MGDTVIRVENLWKEYQLGVINHHTLNHDLQSWWAKVWGKEDPNSTIGTGPFQPEDHFWALQNVSFEVKQGDILGIIGRNGAGKSTLLKILSQVTAPTRGEVRFKGCIASLLEVGTGFHPELTGRENIFLNGAILGMSKADIRKKFDEIVAFAEVEKFIDTPVKRYSSGMYVRLAFAVAAHLEPEILIVDEVLAVGDVQFQKKCLGKMEEVGKEGRTVLFVSHNMAAIRTLCSSVALLDKGNIRGPGEPVCFINQYLVGNDTTSVFWKRDQDLLAQNGIFFEEIRIENMDGQLSDTLASTNSFNVKLTIWSSADLKGTQIAIRVTNQEGVPVFTTTNGDTVGQFREVKKGRQIFKVCFPGSFLSPGKYTLIVASFVPGATLFDVVDSKLGFCIEDMGTHATIMKDGRLGIVTPILPWDEV